MDEKIKVYAEVTINGVRYDISNSALNTEEETIRAIFTAMANSVCRLAKEIEGK